MEMKIRLKGGKKVVAEFEGFAVPTDQPRDYGGEGSAPAPFDLFLASLGTCAGYFVQAFCEKRGIPVHGIVLTQSMEWDESDRLSLVVLDIVLPPEFPEKYRDALVKSANLCSVKRALQNPPEIQVRTSVCS